MRTYHIIVASAIIFILAPFLALSSEYQLVSFSNDMSAESFRQELCAAFYCVSLVIEDSEVETDMPDDIATIHSRIDTLAFNHLKIHMSLEKPVFLIQKSFHGHSPRSPA